MAVVLRKGLRLVGVGMVLGILASIALTRLVASQFWGVSPITFAGVMVVLAIVERRRAWFLPAALRASIPWWRCGMNEDGGSGAPQYQTIRGS